MSLRLSSKAQRAARGLVLGLLLSLSSGYVLFLVVFPTVGFPASQEPSLALLLLAIPPALVAGFAADDLPLALASTPAAIVGSIVVATLMALSPVVGGLAFFDPGSIPGFVVHYGFVFIAMTFVINMVGILVGYGLRERFIVSRPLP